MREEELTLTKRWSTLGIVESRGLVRTYWLFCESMRMLKPRSSSTSFCLDLFFLIPPFSSSSSNLSTASTFTPLIYTANRGRDGKQSLRLYWTSSCTGQNQSGLLADVGSWELNSNKWMPVWMLTILLLSKACSSISSSRRSAAFLTSSKISSSMDIVLFWARALLTASCWCFSMANSSTYSCSSWRAKEPKRRVDGDVCDTYL